MDPSEILSDQSVEDVFKNFTHRRLGLIKALTSDVEDFSQQCANEKDQLCLYGLPNDKWEVKLPVEEVPPEIPEPVVGINSAKGRMEEKEWLALVAMHSDAWLISVAYYFGGRFGFDKYDRKRLFNMINDLPTIFELVTGTTEKQVKEEERVDIVCGKCEQSNAPDGFWICCDMCERWFHGPCVEMTPAGVEHIKEYKCPSCSKKRPHDDC